MTKWQGLNIEMSHISWNIQGFFCVSFKIDGRHQKPKIKVGKGKSKMKRLIFTSLNNAAVVTM